MSKAKENANPQVFRVETDRAHTRKGEALDWSDLGDFNHQGISLSSSSSSFNNNKPDVVIPTTVQDKAILQALIDCSVLSRDGKGVSLLRNAGLSIPSPLSYTNNLPLFRVITENNNNSKINNISNTDDTNHTSNGLGGGGKSMDVDPTIENAGLAQRNSSTTKQSTTTTATDDSSNGKFRQNPIDPEEIFDIIRNIQDPEHPHSLEQLGVVSREQVTIQVLEDKVNTSDNDDDNNYNDHTSLAIVEVRFTPTIPHCSMATLIGLCIKVKLLRSLGNQTTKFKVNVQIEPGTHASEKAINKQLRDKERVCAALENKHLAGVVNKCIRSGGGY
jgi:metal-sulfur cluster biosynthetic enzyme